MACGVGRYRRRGRELRSRKPSWPSLRYRSTHLRTVREQPPAASLTAFGVCPLAPCRAIRSRPRGVRRAFLCTFIRFSLGILKSQQPQSPRSEPDGQPIESSQLERVIKRSSVRKLQSVRQSKALIATDSKRFRFVDPVKGGAKRRRLRRSRHLT